MTECTKEITCSQSLPFLQQACQHGGTVHGKDYDFSLGKMTSAEWNIFQLHPLNFSVTYMHGDASSPKGEPIERYIIIITAAVGLIEFAVSFSLSFPQYRAAIFHFEHSNVHSAKAFTNTDQDSDTLTYVSSKQ